MNIAEYAIKKKTVTIVLVVFVTIGGIWSFDRLGRLEDPEYTIKDALVTTLYPGATPVEVEEEVTELLETAIQQLPQLKRIESISKSGISIITVKIKDNYTSKDLPQVWDELRRKVYDVQLQLPPGVQPPMINDDFGDVYGILLALRGKGYSYRELEQYGDFLRRELLLVKDVAKVQLWGVQPQEVHVKISQEKLAQLGIGLERIYRTLAKQNLVRPSGGVRVGSEYIRILPTGDYTSVEQIGNLLIRGDNAGDVFYLKDIATVERAYQTPPVTLVRHNNENVLVLGVSIVSGGNVVNMGEAIKKRLDQLVAETPVGINIDVITYQPDSVSDSINNFMMSLVQALVIVLVVLMIFMGLRSGLLIGGSLLLTVFATFVGMYLWQINLERISLGALIIALGMLVDNAIVVTEGMLVKIQAGVERIKAARDVVAQNSMPLLGATIIAILAFAAIGLSDDSTGEYTRSLFQVILLSLLLSWLIAVTVQPLFCIMFIKANTSGKQKNDPYAGVLFVFYRKFLNFCLKLRWMTMILMVGLLIFAIHMFAYIEQSFFPNSTRPQFLVHYWMPEGTDIRQTSSELEEIEKHIKSMEGVTTVTTFVGSGAPRFVLTYSPEKNYDAYGVILVGVKDFTTIDAMLPKIYNYIVDKHPNGLPTLKKFVLGPGRENSLEARFDGPSPSVLRQLANRAKSLFYDDGGAYGIKDNWRERIKVVRPKYEESQARQAGVTKNDLEDMLQKTFSGLDVGIYRDKDKILPIKSLGQDWEANKIESINSVQVWSPVAQRYFPIRQIVTDFESSWEDGVIHRRNKKRTITVQANQKIGNASVVLNRVMPKIDKMDLPLGYSLEWGGEYEDAQDAQTALFSSIPMVVVLMIIILIMLFNAVRQPLIIILTVPLSIIGVSLGLLMTGQSFGFMALLGFLSLSGMLIKNSIVLIDEINIQIASGKEHYQAIIDASISRLRPVSMAALTTVLGMIPLLPDIFFVSMAVTIMTGLTFATVLTLIVVPVLYAILFRIPNPQLTISKGINDAA